MSEKTFSLAELAQLVGAQLVGDSTYRISGVAGLESATPSQASYLTVNPYGGSVKSYESAMLASQAGVIVMEETRGRPEGKQLLLVKDPSRAFQTLIELFYAPIASGFSGIHATAVIHPTAVIGDRVVIGPYAVIDREVRIGAGTSIGSHVFVGAQTEIGADCTLHPHVTVREGCRLGARVILQPGVVLGSCGFGYTTDKMGKHHKLQQLGQVVLEDDVEIGANTTIDRARLGVTIIKSGTKVDNLVMIAHGVEIGQDNLIIAQTGIAGTSKTGKRVVLAGQVGVAGHLKIGDDVHVAARAGVIGDLEEEGQYYGEPARPKAVARRHWMRLLSLEKWHEQLKAVERKVEELSRKADAH
jgi:UDP-3-O-[3-hydroxymyristoyl] glucosamine N-acyltransferase